eukprot:1825307-Alexandrium_andersonii.AAC.1
MSWRPLSCRPGNWPGGPARRGPPGSCEAPEPVQLRGPEAPTHPRGGGSEPARPRCPGRGTAQRWRGGGAGRASSRAR